MYKYSFDRDFTIGNDSVTITFHMMTADRDDERVLNYVEIPDLVLTFGEDRVLNQDIDDYIDSDDFGIDAEDAFYESY